MSSDRFELTLGERTVSPGCFSRTPILDRLQRLSAFEITWPERFGGPATGTPSWEVGPLIGRHPVFIPLERKSLLSDTVMTLPREQVVLQLPDDLEPEAEIIARCRNLKSQRFQLAALARAFDPHAAVLYDLVSFAKLDIFGLSAERARADVRTLKQFPLKLIARGVNDQPAFRTAFELGMDLFEGFYFARPSVINRKHFDLSALCVVRLLNQLVSEDGLDSIESTVRQNPMMVSGLLRLVNSVAFGLRGRVQTLRHAIIVLGRQHLLRWAHLALFASGDSGTPGPLLEIAALRARLMELLIQNHPATNLDFSLNEHAFTAGVLSLVEVLFAVPMDEILRQMNVSEDVRDALQRREGILGRLICLMERLEENDFLQVMRILDEIGISKDCFERSHLQAIQWTNALFDSK